MSLFGSVLVFGTEGGGTSIKFCFCFLNLLYKRYPPIANPRTLRLPAYKQVLVSGLGLCSAISSCFVICSFNHFSSSFLCLLYSTNFFLAHFSEGSSVCLQFLVAGSQVPLFDLSFNLVIEFFV